MEEGQLGTKKKADGKLLAQHKEEGEGLCLPIVYLISVV